VNLRCGRRWAYASHARAAEHPRAETYCQKQNQHRDGRDGKVMVGASPSFERPSSLPIHDCSFVLSNCSADKADGGPSLRSPPFGASGSAR
jgi:hypothetical protein